MMHSYLDAAFYQTWGIVGGGEVSPDGRLNRRIFFNLTDLIRWIDCTFLRQNENGQH